MADDATVRILCAETGDEIVTTEVPPFAVPLPDERLRMDVDPRDGQPVRFEGTVEDRAFSTTVDGGTMGTRRTTTVSLHVQFDRLEIKNPPHRFQWTPVEDIDEDVFAEDE